jgi:hypothetical protein
MSENEFNAKRALLVTRMLFFALFGASVAYTAMVFVVISGKYFFRFDSLDVFLMSPYIIGLAAVAAGYIYSAKIIRDIKPDSTLQNKYQVYQTSLIIKLASCEGVALYSVIFLLLTGNLAGIIPAFAALLVMVANFPTPDRIARIINLSPSETEQFY